MTKQLATNLLKRIYKALRDNDVRVYLCRKIDPAYGTITCLDTSVTIKINPLKKGARGGLVSTTLHECLHLLEMEDEEWVREIEIEMFAVLTDRQLTNLFKRVWGRNETDNT